MDFKIQRQLAELVLREIQISSGKQARKGIATLCCEVTEGGPAHNTLNERK